MENFEVERLPRWIKKVDDCLWCNHEVELYCVRPVSGFLQCWYACNNEDCEYLKTFGKQQTQGINMTGGFLDSYKRHLEEERKAKENKPEEYKEATVPTEIKVG